MRFLKKFLAAVLVSLSFGALALGYVSPGSPKGYVNDYAGVLNTSWVESQNNALKTLDATTGTEIAVVTIPSLGGDTIENYAVKLFQEWGIGKKGKDNGILILLAMSDREVRIEVGYGLEGTITDAESSRIIQNMMIPELKNGNTEKALSSGLNRIRSILGNPASGTSTQQMDYERALNILQQKAAENERMSIPFMIAFIGAFMVGIMRFIEFLIRGREKKLWWAAWILAVVIGFLVLLIPGVTSEDAFAVGFINFTVYNIIYWFGGTLINILQFLSIFGGGSSGGGFGGFGGGRSGGGGASGRW